MKKFAIWLAYVTGADEHFRRKHYREVGDRIDSAHYWFNGGVDGSRKVDVLNTLFLIGKELKEKAWFDIQLIRKQVYQMSRPYFEHENDEIGGM
jgi:hypothetical protein